MAIKPQEKEVICSCGDPNCTKIETKDWKTHTTRKIKSCGHWDSEPCACKPTPQPISRGRLIDIIDSVCLQGAKDNMMARLTNEEYPNIASRLADAILKEINERD